MKGVLVVIGLFILIGYLANLFFIRRKELKMKSKLLFLFALIPLLTGCGMEQVDEGYRGLYMEFGKLVGEPLSPGLHFYNPFTSDIQEIDVREAKVEGTTECFTSDNQIVNISFTGTYYPKHKEIHMLYSQFGNGWATTVVPQVVLGSLKDATGQYKADDLVSKRDSVRAKAQEEIRAALDSRGVILTRIDLTNIAFHPEYARAVEAKVVAVQQAAEAKNRTVQIEEEAKQKILAAKADAEAMRIKTQALSQNKGLVDYEAVQKWNGQLPQYILGGGTLPFLHLNK